MDGGVLYKVRAIADYVANSETEISLTEGEIYSVVADDGRGIWLQAFHNSMYGWFPSSYVVQVENQITTEEITKSYKTPTLYQGTDVNSTQQDNPLVEDSSAEIAAGVTPVIPTLQVNVPQPDNSFEKSLKTPVSSRDNKKRSGLPDKKKPSQTKLQSKSSSTKLKASKKKKKVVKKKRRPAPLKSFVEKNKKGLPCSLHIQVISSKLSVPPKSDIQKLKVSAHVFIKDIFSNEERKVGSTETIKRDLNPIWRYLFKCVIKDAEVEVAIVRLCQGENYDKKKVFGETHIVLRGSERNFDSPKFSTSWYEVSNRENNVIGRIRLCLEFLDSRQTSLPSNFQHHGHIGWSESGFSVENIPQELKDLFKEVGITKTQLQNKEFAKTVFDIVKDYSPINDAPNPIQQSTHAPESPNTSTPLPPDIEIPNLSASDSDIESDSSDDASESIAPVPLVDNIPKPPPPLISSPSPSPENIPTPPSNSIAPSPPPPPPLLTHKPPESHVTQESVASKKEKAEDLATHLRDAMMKFRGELENDNDEDDWSSEEDEEEEEDDGDDLD